MSAKSEITEKKLENLENDVVNMEEKVKELQERLRQKKVKTEETRNLAIVEIVRERNMSISDLKTILNGGGKLLDNPKSGAANPVQIPEAVTSAAEKTNNRKENTDYEEIN